MPVANAENGNAELVDAAIDGRAGWFHDARWTAGDDDAARRGKTGGRRVDVGHRCVNTELADAARDQVAVLTTRVEDDDLAHRRAALTAAAPASGPAGRPCPPS